MVNKILPVALIHDCFWPMSAPLKQYIFLRGDLKDFSKGSLIAQACHGTTLATFTHKDHPSTVAYLKNIHDMHKVVLKIKEDDMPTIEAALTAEDVGFSVWIEAPENTATCLCTRPFVLEENSQELQDLFHKFKLF